jgi:hypothetical protein
MRTRYTYVLNVFVAGAVTLVTVVMSFFESTKGWDQLALNGLAMGESAALSYVVLIIMVPLVMLGLFCLLMFTSMGFVEVRRQLLLSELRDLEKEREKKARKGDARAPRISVVK